MFALIFYLLPGYALITWLAGSNLCPLDVCRALAILPPSVVEGVNLVLAFTITWAGVALARYGVGEAWMGSRVTMWGAALFSRQGMSGFYRLVMIGILVLLILGWRHGARDAAVWVLGALLWLAAWQELSGGALGRRAQTALAFPRRVVEHLRQPNPERNDQRSRNGPLEVLDDLWVVRLRRDGG